MRTPALFIAALVLLSGCPKKDEPKAVHKSEPVAAAPKNTKTAEVEFFGSALPGKATNVAKTVFVVMSEPCTPVPAEAHLVGKAEFKEKIFAEFFPEQGTKAHLCVYGFDDKGAVVAVGAYEKNPVTLEGKGEVIFEHVDVTLEPLASPASAPKGM